MLLLCKFIGFSSITLTFKHFLIFLKTSFINFILIRERSSFCWIIKLKIICVTLVSTHFLSQHFSYGKHLLVNITFISILYNFSSFYQPKVFYVYVGIQKDLFRTSTFLQLFETCVNFSHIPIIIQMVPSYLLNWPLTIRLTNFCLPKHIPPIAYALFLRLSNAYKVARASFSIRTIRPSRLLIRCTMSMSLRAHTVHFWVGWENQYQFALDRRSYVLNNDSRILSHIH